MDTQSFGGKREERCVTRRDFLGLTLASGAALLSSQASALFGAGSAGASDASATASFRIGGDLTVNRLGFGAMRLTGEGILGGRPGRGNARKVLRGAVE